MFEDAPRLVRPGVSQRRVVSRRASKVRSPRASGRSRPDREGPFLAAAPYRASGFVLRVVRDTQRNVTPELKDTATNRQLCHVGRA